MIYKNTESSFMFFDKKAGNTGLITGQDFKDFRRLIKKNKNKNNIKNRISKYINLDEDFEMVKEAFKHPFKSIDRALSTPESLHIELTSGCNLNCKQCYKNIEISKYFDYERLVSIINEAHKIKIFQITLGGGEPLLYSKIVDIVNLISSYDMASSITTNGKLLNSDYLEKLLNAGLNHIQVSLNSTVKGVNDLSRDGYEDAIAALELLSKSNISFGINMTLFKDNIKDLESMIEYGLKLKSNNINLLRYKPSYKHGLENKELDVKDYDYIKDIFNKYKNSEIDIKVDSAFSNLLIYLNRGRVSNYYSGCTAGRRFMSIDVDGKFKVCSHLSEYSDETSILKFWQNDKLCRRIRKLEEKIKEPCKSCKYLIHCRGCRAICLENYNDFYEGEKKCIMKEKTI